MQSASMLEKSIYSVAAYAPSAHLSHSLCAHCVELQFVKLSLDLHTLCVHMARGPRAWTKGKMSQSLVKRAMK